MDELERTVLGCLILRPEFLEKFDLNSNLFSSARNKKILSEVRKLWEKEHPSTIDLVILADRLGEDGIHGYLLNITEGIPYGIPEETFNHYFVEFKKKKLTEKIIKKINHQARTGQFNFEEIRTLVNELDRIGQPKIDINRVLKKGDELQVLKIEVEWLVEKLIPKRSIILLSGKGGTGKSFLALQISKSLSEGRSLFELQTARSMVFYLDYENSYPLLIERLRKLDVREVFFWHLSAEISPPRLDEDNWQLLFELPRDSLIIFDTLRAAHHLDENSSRDMAIILGRLKELREAGFTILLIHHTGKADDRVYKGSTAISDLADHVLALYKIKRDSFEIDDSPVNPGDYFWLGTWEKSRYEPFHMYLHFSEDGSGFVLAEDPDQENLEAISDFIQECGYSPSQSEIFEWAKNNIEINRKGKLTALLQRGEGKYWRSRKEGRRRVYEII